MGGGPIRLLVVEDNPADAYLLSRHASRSEEPRLELIHVEMIADAVARLSDDSEIDAVLLDLGLPDCEGVESVRRVVDTRPDIPIVVLTALDSAETGLAAVQLGAEDYVVKRDFDGDAITRSILFAIERSRLKQQLKLVVARSADATVVIGGDDTVRYANQAALDLLGEDVVGTRIAFSVVASNITEIEIHRTAEGQPRRGPLAGEIPGEGGERRFCEVSARRIDWRGEVALLASIRDVTDLHRARELDRELLKSSRLSAVGQLASGVAHEINNPITYLASNIAVLRQMAQEISATITQAVDDPRLLESFNEAQILLNECAVGVARLSNVSRDLASFSRIETEELELFDVNDAVTVACKLARTDVQAVARLKIKLGKLPPISGHPAKLSLAFVNLLTNAVGSIAPGRPLENSVRIESFERAEAVVVQISDSGEPIPERDLDRIFEPFYSRDARPGWAGLALSIAAETVEKHGGAIRVLSSGGDGTRIEVTFPSADIRGFRVLVIDDDPAVLRALQRMLRLHHEVVAAPGGARALEILDADAGFDAILCDIGMPGMDGVDVYEAITERHPHLVSALIFMTGGGAAERRVFDKRGIAVLEKPVATKKLLATVRQVAADREAAR